jgi:hypothetical protein
MNLYTCTKIRIAESDSPQGRECIQILIVSSDDEETAMLHS